MRRLKSIPAGPIRWTLLIVAILCGCVFNKRPIMNYQELTLSVACGDFPRSIAVLPFQNRTRTEGLDELVRSSFYSHLSVKPYRDIELQEVDKRLESIERRTGRKFLDIPVEDLGSQLGCDAVVFGEVTEFERVFVGIYSQMAIGASISIWDTRSGREIWSDSHTVRYHEGGIPLNPVDIPFISYRTGMNLRASVKMRAIDELGRYLAGRVPAPPQLSCPQGGGGVSYAYELQVGAFLNAAKAEVLLRSIRSLGQSAFLRRNRDNHGLLWYRVVMGPYESVAEANSMGKMLRERLRLIPIVIRVPSKAHPRAGSRR